MHPESDAEKILVDGVPGGGGLTDDRAARGIGRVYGRYQDDGRGALLSSCEYYDELHAELGDEQVIADGRPFRMAYVIHLLDRMIRDGIPVHCVAVPGDYHEVDTVQDYHLATADWMRFRHLTCS